MDEILELRAELDKYNHAYHVLDNPLVSDLEYDQLMQRLRFLEQLNPESVKPESITQRVGAKPDSGFAEVEHVVRLYSLQDVFSEEELRKFHDGIVKILSKEPGDTEPEYIVEPKVDGLSVAVEYIDGKLFRAATRGDGVTGEDVTQNALTIKNLPQVIKNAPPQLIVRGEVYMPLEVFEELRDDQISFLGDDKPKLHFANPRNAAAGALRQKNAKLTAERNLSIVIFDILQPNLSFDRCDDMLAALETWGFPVIPYIVCANVDSVVKAIADIRDGGYPYDFDGAVAALNSLVHRKALGYTSRAPRWAAAFKYPPEQLPAVVQDIVIQVGRSGVLTPRAVLSPVILGGTTVTSATLHNADFISERDVRIGDTVFVRKAGEIIPEVVEVDMSKRRGDSEVYVFPGVCPECGAAAVRERREVVMKKSGEVREAVDSAVCCTGYNCPAKLLGNLSHFVGREAMDIEGFGGKTLEKLLKGGFVSRPSDIYNLTYEILESELSPKMANKLAANIEKSKARGLARVLFALGIPHLGKQGAVFVAAHFGGIAALEGADLEEIKGIDGIGGTIAESVYAWFRANREVIEDLRKNGVV
jgi:DNA ligase (NAD+)